MGQWIEKSADLVSVGPGVIVQPNVDRYALYITNLLDPVLHITPVTLPPTSTAGIALNKNVTQTFLWERDGNLARCQWIVTDATGSSEFSVVEGLYLRTGDANG